MAKRKITLDPNNLVLGREMTDEITGFTGIAISKIEYLTGCTQYCLKGKVNKEGKVPEGEWFDWQRLTVTGPGVIETVEKRVSEDESGAGNGGPCPGECLPRL